MISKASSADISALTTLINSAYRGESSKQGWTTEADLIGGLRTDADELQKIFNNPTETILKFTDEANDIIGCVRLKKEDGKIYLGMLTVSPTLQAKGIGKQLLQTAEMFAKEVQAPAIFMTVISVRQELIAWYERQGYQRTGEVRPFEPNERFEILQQPLEFIVLEKKI